MTNKPKDEIVEILKDYKTNLYQQMGFILSGKHHLGIKTADKMLIETPVQALEALMDRVRISELEHLISGSELSKDDIYWYEKPYNGDPKYLSEVPHMTIKERIAQLKASNEHNLGDKDE